MPSGFQADAFQANAFQMLDGATAAEYGRMLMALLPPGKVWNLVDDLMEALLLGSADEIGRVDARAIDLVNEGNPSTATELLPEYEADFGIVAAATVEERRANIVARLVRRNRFRPIDFQNALAPLLAQDPGDVVVIERTAAEAAAMGDPREIYRFFVYRDPDQPIVLADVEFVANPGTDTIEAQPGSHLLKTGDGPLRTTNSGGAPPGNLPVATDYFAIVLDDDNAKLATSRANALAGIAIDITSAGTGTHTLIDQPTTTRLDDYFLTSAQELVDLMKPSHTLGHVIESIDFLCDDPFSLTDRDLLGV